MTLRVLIASGDSVGHLNHATAVLDGLKARGPIEAGVVMAHDSTFRPWVEAKGHPVYCVGSNVGLHHELSRGEIVRNARVLASSTLGAMREMSSVMDRFQPDLVVGTGGRCSFGPMLAAALRGTRCLTVPHFTPRRANRILSLLVDRTCITSDADRSWYPRLGRRGVRVTGTPLRQSALEPLSKSSSREVLGLQPTRLLVGFVGYSRGSPAFSKLVHEAITRIHPRVPEVQFLVQRGEYPLGELPADVICTERPFYDPLSTALSACDLLVCAAGETTLLEAAALGVPMITLSLPDTPIGPHVRHIFSALDAARCALVLPPHAPVAGLVAAVVALISDSGRREMMGAAGRTYARTGGTEKVVAVIEELLAKRRWGAPAPAGWAPRA